jgi:hypothetical protein
MGGCLGSSGNDFAQTLPALDKPFLTVYGGSKNMREPIINNPFTLPKKSTKLPTPLLPGPG